MSEIAIKRLERGGSDPRLSTVNAIERAFAAAGVIFVDDDDTRGYSRGVRFKERGRTGR